MELDQFFKATEVRCHAVHVVTKSAFFQARKQLSRFRAQGPIRGRLHELVFTPRNDAVRIISLRKANSREVHEYEKTQT